MKPLIVAATTLVLPLASLAKLPAPPPDQQAKAEEAKAKADEVAKKEIELTLRYQDRAVANWAANARAQGKPFTPTPLASNPPAQLPAGGTVATTDKVVPKPAEAAASPAAAQAGAQPAQTLGIPQDSAGGAGAPIKR